jgi:hypothetical protein
MERPMNCIWDVVKTYKFTPLDIHKPTLILFWFKTHVIFFDGNLIGFQSSWIHL